MSKQITVVALFTLLISACAPAGSGEKDLSSAPTLKVVATTNMVADLVRTIGGDHVDLVSLMGPGIDPHLYKASEGDVARMAGADVIFYGGLHLEGKMVDIFEQMDSRGKRAVAVTDGIDREKLIESEVFGGHYDPHVWFDVTLWQDAAQYVTEYLSDINSVNQAVYRSNLDTYLQALSETDTWVRTEVNTLDPGQRVLITSHDAFGYFGRAYDFEVYGLQGISTVAEAGTADVQSLSTMVAERRIPAMFVESSVPRRGIEAVQQAVRAKGFHVTIGGSLFSDALGVEGTPEGTYTGMIRHNVTTIISGLSATE